MPPGLMLHMCESETSFFFVRPNARLESITRGGRYDNRITKSRMGIAAAFHFWWNEVLSE